MSITWSDVGGIIGKGAPLIGGLLGGPAGAAVGGMLSTALGVAPAPANVAIALNSDPTAMAKVLELQSAERVRLAELAAQNVEQDTKQKAIVNDTMQVETKSDHWPSYSWRPFIGFCFGIQLFGTYFLLPLLHVPVPAIPETVWMVYGGILGVASWFRGKAQADPTIPTDNRG